MNEKFIFYLKNLTFKYKGHAQLFYFLFHIIGLTFYTQFFKWITKKSFRNENIFYTRSSKEKK